MLFLLACFTKPILSTPSWNRSADIRLIEGDGAPDFSKHGSYRFVLEKGRKRVHDRCTMDYTLYKSKRSNPILVILSHGFGRNQQINL